MDNTSIPTSNTALPAVAPGSVWVGRLKENSSHRMTIVEVRDDSIIIKHEGSGRKTSLSFETLRLRYRSESCANLADETPGASAEFEPQVEHQAESDVEATPIGAELVERAGERLYQYANAPDVVAVRDRDLGARVGLSRPRDIRRAIRNAIDDGAILAMPMAKAAHMRAGIDREPVALEVEARVHGGNDSLTTTIEYHLNERAVVVVLARLRTPKAVQIQVAIADAIALLRQGRVVEAARVVGAPPAAPTVLAVVPETDRAFSLVDRLENEGLLDTRTACLHRVELLRRSTGIDLSRPPAIDIELARPIERVAAAIEQLEEGGKLVLSKPVDVRGHYTARVLGTMVTPPLGRRVVAMVGRAMGLRGDETRGKWTSITNNGAHELDRGWNYSESAKALMLPVLQEVTTRVAAKTRRQKTTDIVAEVCAKHPLAKQGELPLESDGKAA